MIRWRGTCAGLLAWLAVASGSALAADRPALSIASTAFEDHASIPGKYTCDGINVSPPLRWTGVPGNARSLVLVVDDPDAPDPAAPKITWVHWVLYNLPASATALPENVSSGRLPAGTLEGMNSWGKTGYGGPCPPIGRHRYLFKLYALDTRLTMSSPPDEKTLDAAMQGHVIAQTMLTGTYRKSR